MKIYLLGLGTMMVGAGFMFVLIHGEVTASDVFRSVRKEMHCDYFISQDGHEKASYCKIKDLTCASMNTGGISCVKE